MRPLLKNDLSTFLKRFGNFIDAELRSMEIVTPTTVKITFTTQDAARGFDWITVELEFNGVSDARVLESSKLPHVDLSEGITLIHEDGSFGFAIGSYKYSAITNSICYLKASSIKYSEGSF